VAVRSVPVLALVLFALGAVAVRLAVGVAPQLDSPAAEALPIGLLALAVAALLLGRRETLGALAPAHYGPAEQAPLENGFALDRWIDREAPTTAQQSGPFPSLPSGGLSRSTPVLALGVFVVGLVAVRVGVRLEASSQPVAGLVVMVAVVLAGVMLFWGQESELDRLTTVPVLLVALVVVGTIFVHGATLLFATGAPAASAGGGANSLGGAASTASPTPSPSPTNTSTASPTPTATPTASPTPTATPSPTPSPTPTPTATPSPTPSPTPTPTPTPTPSPTPTPTPTATPSPTPTPTPTPSPTPTATPTDTPVDGGLIGGV